MLSRLLHYIILCYYYKSWCIEEDLHDVHLFHTKFTVSAECLWIVPHLRDRQKDRQTDNFINPPREIRLSTSLNINKPKEATTHEKQAWRLQPATTNICEPLHRKLQAQGLFFNRWTWQCMFCIQYIMFMAT